MNDDSIEAILDDATMSPEAYCHKWGCGRGVHEEPADYVPDMCAHLVGRTEAVMRPRLMPEGMEWLRYDTGEPVPLGGEVTATAHNKDGDSYRTFAIRSVKYKENGVLLEGTKNEMVLLPLGERVKRPAPKALDADGAEIREGDTVYLLPGRWCGEFPLYGYHEWDEMEVLSLSPSNETSRIECRASGGYSCYPLPSQVTHRAPVLAADGVPLREGETVYGIGRTQHRFVVRAASDYEEDEPDGRFCVPCIDKDDGDEECWCDPSQLTHERPDSWERLEEDVTLSVEKYRERYGIKRHDGMTWPQLVREDLVRRARALAERGR